MTRTLGWLAAAALALMMAAPADAKKFKYEGGPPAPSDTALSVATSEFEPIVRARGPRVPLTNFQLVGLVAGVAIDRGIQEAPIDSSAHVMIAPAEAHPLNFMIEHAVLRSLARRGVSVTVRRQVVPDDSLMAIAGNPGDPLLEYQLATARVTYLRLRGWLPGRVKIERQGLVETNLTLRDPGRSTVLWSGTATHNLVDAFPRGQLALVEDARFTDLKSEVPGRTVDKALEPVIVVAIVAGLIALFFQNRP